MDYSICLLNADGHTQRSTFGPFSTDAAALDQARTYVPEFAIVEVWRNFQLVERLFRNPPTLGAVR